MKKGRFLAATLFQVVKWPPFELNITSDILMYRLLQLQEMSVNRNDEVTPDG